MVSLIVLKIATTSHLKKNCGEAKSVDVNSEAMNDLVTELKGIMAEFTPDYIFNADETGLFYKLLPEKNFRAQRYRLQWL